MEANLVGDSDKWKRIREKRKRSFVKLSTTIVLVTACIWLLLFLLMQMWILAGMVGLVMLLSIYSLYLIRHNKIESASLILLISGGLYIFLVCWLTSGPLQENYGTHIWFIALALVSYFLLFDFKPLVREVFALAMLSMVFIFHFKLIQGPNLYVIPTEMHLFISQVDLATVLLIIFFLTRAFFVGELGLERERSDRLKQVDKMKDEFLANTSHELRTPLNGIIGITESLMEDATDQEVRRNLGMVISSGKRLASLVNDLLDFSRIRNADLYLRQRPLDLRSIVNVVLMVSRPLISNKMVELICKVPGDLPAVYADEDRLSQVLYNLVGNAIKFTEKGSVTISARQRDDMIELCVADTGIGIAGEKQEAVFKAFEQGDGSIAREYGGSGLGLSITRVLIEAHGGRIWVESEEGKGAAFFFTIPFTNEKAVAAGDQDARLTPWRDPIDNMEDVAPQAVNAGRAPHDVLRVLIVDDEPINHQVLKNHLKNRPLEVVSAMNGQEALGLVEKQETPFDLVLLDVMMPRMSGYEVCKTLREKHLPSELPVIIVTAKNQVNDLVHGLSIGANDYISKPFGKNEFLARIDTHLGLHRINRATNRFVPSEFIRALGREAITDVRLGDNTSSEVTVFFSDIRSYTTLAETMSPEENFDFVNAYARRMGPIILAHHGFVNQFQGDGIMALFQHSPSDALRAAIAMQEKLREYNLGRRQKGLKTIAVGMGMHTGQLIMGIIGDDKRSDTAIIADTVNAAARLEGITKHYRTNIILSETCYSKLSKKEQDHCRYLGLVQVKGKEHALGIYECLDGQTSELKDGKLSTLADFNKGMQAYLNGHVQDAVAAFGLVMSRHPEDFTAGHFMALAQKLADTGIPEGWNGVETMESK